MSTSSAGDGYHHGDLAAACLAAALELLEQGDVAALSLRAVARRVGVTPSAPYRHFADKDALLAALAAEGYRNLAQRMEKADSMVSIAQAYVSYAMEHPALFRLMFGHPCGATPETATAAEATRAALARHAERLVPEDRRQAFMTGCWSLVHGLATLTLNGKLPASQTVDAKEQVASVVVAMLGEGESGRQRRRRL